MTIQTGEIGTVVGNIDRPTLGCKVDLFLDKATSQAITLTERFAPQTGCFVSGQSVAGTKIVASVSGTTMDWKEFQGDPSSGNPIATAMLTKTR